MAAIDGIKQKRVVLAANIETIISFNPAIKSISIMADGGTIYFKINGTIVDNNDMSANYIKDGMSFECIKDGKISELHAYTTTSNVMLQWDMP